MNRRVAKGVEIPAWTYRFLIEVWAEPRSTPELPARIRARVRDMERKRERYVGSVAEIGAVIDQRLDEAGVTPRAWERDAGKTPGAPEADS